jgi:hypothetical protein
MSSAVLVLVSQDGSDLSDRVEDQDVAGEWVGSRRGAVEMFDRPAWSPDSVSQTDRAA